MGQSAKKLKNMENLENIKKGTKLRGLIIVHVGCVRFIFKT